MSLAFLDGNFVSLKKAKVSIFDRGFLYGDGVFETMRAYDGSVFKLESHIERLMISLEILKIKEPYAKKTLQALVSKTLSVNKLKNAYIKLIVTRGIGPIGVDIMYVQRPTVVIYAKRLGKISDEIYRKGVAVNFPCIRRNEKSFTARIKSLNYIDNILARTEVRNTGYFEALLLNTRNMITETATSNIFMIKNRKIITPPPTAGLLPGITRKVIIELIRRYTYNTVLEKDISVSMLNVADEIFLTNSILEIVPVIKVGRKAVGKGKPGSLYKIIHELYRKETR